MFRQKNAISKLFFKCKMKTQMLILLLVFCSACGNNNIKNENNVLDNKKAIFEKKTQAHYEFKEEQLNEQTKDSLINACIYGQSEIVKKLIDSGCNVNMKVAKNPYKMFSSYIPVAMDTASDDWYPIMFALYGHHTNIVKLLLENGAKIDVVDRSGLTVLMYAVIYDNMWTINYLLNRSININQKSKGGYTAIMYSDTLRNNEIYYTFKNLGAETNIYLAVKHKDRAYVKEKLVKNPLLANSVDQDGWPLLTLACINGDVDLVKLLIRYKADVNKMNKFDGTPLMHAALRKYIKIVKILLNSGADVNAKDNLGSYVIIWAVRSNFLDVVKLIVEKGANINVNDNDGKTTLSWARSNSEIYKYLFNNFNKNI